jgi:hypothetical protein
MAAQIPYTISVPDAALEKLHRKLHDADYPDELSDVKRLASYWENGFDWRKAEAKLNELPNFRADVKVEGFGDVNVHYVHQESGVEGAVPLLFVHGCMYFLCS